MLNKKELKKLIKHECIELGALTDSDSINTLVNAITEFKIQELDSCEVFLLADILDALTDEYPELVIHYNEAQARWFDLNKPSNRN